MPIKLLMPALSPTMESGSIAKWLKKEGDAIKIGDVLAEIETDKATMELESIEEGILGKIVFAEGAKDVKVNAIIGFILQEGEDASSLGAIEVHEAAAPTHDNKNASLAPLAPVSSQDVLNKAALSSQNLNTAHNKDGELIFASPLAKRLALEHNLSLSSIVGTGPRGRIIKGNVLDALEHKSVNTPKLQEEVANQFIPHNNIRKIIASRLLEAKQTIPHFYLSIDCNVDKLLTLRKQINDSGKAKLSVNDFVIKAVALAMHKVPEINASWSDEGIILYSSVDVSVAVAIDSGLITPIIRQANIKSLSQLSAEMKILADRARSGKLMPNEYQGGGFTISNLGMFNIKSFSAIINPPQSAILAIGALEKRPIVDEKDQIVVANIMNVTLSCDHRIVDGALGAKWLNEFRDLMQNPLLMLI
jgi:pyruvate dehydrogenase E2 component (dihydrolipoamide acetyltransferase)